MAQFHTKKLGEIKTPDLFFASLALLAQKALMTEAVLLPKPGLVDPQSPGAHKDMNIQHFVDSALGLYDAFVTFAKIGYENADQMPQDIVSKIKARGILAEQEMFTATGGINTHKGAIFSMGYLLCSAGIQKAKGDFTVAAILQRAKILAQDLVQKELGHVGELEDQSTLTHGEALFLKHGLTGARGEAESGFQNAIPAYQMLQKLDKHNFHQEELLLALLQIMSQNQDTNVVSRGGIQALPVIQQKSKELLKLRGKELIQGLEQMDEYCIQKNISPGGSADLLSIALLLTYIEN